MSSMMRRPLQMKQKEKRTTSVYIVMYVDYTPYEGYEMIDKVYATFDDAAKRVNRMSDVMSEFPEVGYEIREEEVYGTQKLCKKFEC